MTANDKPIETPPEPAPSGEAAEPVVAATPTAPGAAYPAATAGPGPDIGDRMGALGREAGAAGERFGREAQAAGERFGREAQAAGERLQRDPAFVGAADWASRAWGLIVLAFGLWFLADITLGFDLPSLAWGAIWPLVLVVIGLAVILRGLARRG